MPEVAFTIRWPDGWVQECYSPSRVIEQALAPGVSYPAEEFVTRARRALEQASELVRAKYGYACTASQAQLEAIETAAHTHAPDPRARVSVETLALLAADPQESPAGFLPERVPVLVVGGGQAGLSVSWYLTKLGIEHLMLERERLFSSWRGQRWDSFSLVTPNWQCRLPGHHYQGEDPDGFMVRDEIVGYLEDYARRLRPPVVEGVEVREIRPGSSGGFLIDTSAGQITAAQVVLTVGGYHHPRMPPLAGELPDQLAQVHTARYRNPSSLPDGAVLVVGSGQSGAQIAEDLHRAGRQVHIAVGRAPRIARAYRGRDVVAWLQDMGHYDLAVDDHPMGLDARKEANHYVTGRDGGHDIDLRAFANEGMKLHGRLLGLDGRVLRFADDLARNLDNADAVLERNKDAIDEHITQQHIDAPQEARYTAPWRPAPREGLELDIDAAGLSAVVWATGFSTDWSWVHFPAFDERGYPDGARGATSVDGLYALGLPWLYTWGSGRFAGIARDAAHVVALVSEHVTDAHGLQRPAAV